MASDLNEEIIFESSLDHYEDDEFDRELKDYEESSRKRRVESDDDEDDDRSNRSKFVNERDFSNELSSESSRKRLNTGSDSNASSSNNSQQPRGQQYRNAGNSKNRPFNQNNNNRNGRPRMSGGNNWMNQPPMMMNVPPHPMMNQPPFFNNQPPMFNPPMRISFHPNEFNAPHPPFQPPFNRDHQPFGRPSPVLHPVTNQPLGNSFMSHNNFMNSNDNFRNNSNNFREANFRDNNFRDNNFRENSHFRESNNFRGPPTNQQPPSGPFNNFNHPNNHPSNHPNNGQFNQPLSHQSRPPLIGNFNSNRQQSPKLELPFLNPPAMANSGSRGNSSSNFKNNKPLINQHLSQSNFQSNQFISPSNPPSGNALSPQRSSNLNSSNQFNQSSGSFRRDAQIREANQPNSALSFKNSPQQPGNLRGPNNQAKNASQNGPSSFKQNSGYPQTGQPPEKFNSGRNNSNLKSVNPELQQSKPNVIVVKAGSNQLTAGQQSKPSQPNRSNQQAKSGQQARSNLQQNDQSAGQESILNMIKRKPEEPIKVNRAELEKELNIDEEYKKRLELQKRRREEFLRAKEEKRKQIKAAESNVQQANNQANDKNDHQAGKSQAVNQKPAPMAIIQPKAESFEMKQIVDSTVERTVKIRNLALSCKLEDIVQICNNIGPTETLNINISDGDKNALVVFRRKEDTISFQKRYNLTMLDESLIKVELL